LRRCLLCQWFVNGCHTRNLLQQNTQHLTSLEVDQSLVIEFNSINMKPILQYQGSPRSAYWPATGGGERLHCTPERISKTRRPRCWWKIRNSDPHAHYHGTNERPRARW
jgi:hypothetical protein